jgi:hypothetical protein
MKKTKPPIKNKAALAEAKLHVFRSEVHDWLLDNERSLSAKQIARLKQIIGVPWENLRPSKGNAWFDVRVILTKIGYEVDFSRGGRSLGGMCRDYGADLVDCYKTGTKLIEEIAQLVHNADERQHR